MLEQSQIDDFQRNGAVLLKGVFADFVETAREAIEENMQNPSWRERTYRPDDGGQAFFQDYVVWDQFDGYHVCFMITFWSKNPGIRSSPRGIRISLITCAKGVKASVFGSRWIISQGNERLNISRVRTDGVKISNHSVLMEPTCSKGTQARWCQTLITCGMNWISWGGKWNQGMQ